MDKLERDYQQWQSDLTPEQRNYYKLVRERINDKVEALELIHNAQIAEERRIRENKLRVISRRKNKLITLIKNEIPYFNSEYWNEENLKVAERIFNKIGIQ